MRALIAYVRSGVPDLTNRQMALLMLVYLTPGPHTVRGLAKVKAVVTWAVLAHNLLRAESLRAEKRATAGIPCA